VSEQHENEKPVEPLTEADEHKVSEKEFRLISYYLVEILREMLNQSRKDKE
jgi:hypothetical protein